jgi:hypothetical protein
MADLTVELIEGAASPLAQQVYLTPPSPVSGKGTVLMFSGGIGHYYYAPARSTAWPTWRCTATWGRCWPNRSGGTRPCRATPWNAAG